MAGGLIGIALSVWATRAVAVFRLAAPVPLDLTVNVDAQVLVYSFILSVLAGTAFGLVPAWSAVRPAISGSLSQDQTLARSGRLFSVRNLIVISQISMSVILLCATSLFLRSLGKASRIDIGFRSRGLLMMSIDPRLHGYTPKRSVQLLHQIQEKVGSVPGVISTAYTDAIPLNGGHRSDGFQVEGKAAQPGDRLSTCTWQVLDTSPPWASR